MPNYLTSIEDYSREELLEELSKRQGIERLTVASNSAYQIIIDKCWNGKREDFVGEGMAVVFVVSKQE